MSQKPKSQRLVSLRKFLDEYKRSKLGVAGAIIVVLFVLIAILAPLLTDHNPITDQNLASPLSIPIWARSFPQYSNLPVNSQLLSGISLSSSSDLQNWNFSSRPVSSSSSQGQVTYQTTSQGLVVNFSPTNTSSSSSNPLSTFFGSGSTSSNASLVLNQTFTYPWSYPCGFTITLNLTPLNGTLTSSNFSVSMFLQSVNGKNYWIYGPGVYANPADSVEYFPLFKTGQSYTLTASPKNTYVVLQSTGSSFSSAVCGLAHTVFPRSGTYRLTLLLSSTTSTSVRISDPSLDIVGSAYGILGTDNLGRDVWAQFVYGARPSLEVGLFAAMIAVMIGTVVGLVAGFMGGLVDEGLMRFNDFLLTLPFLPLTLVILEILEVSDAAKNVSTELIILLLIGLLGWNGIARIIRAQVLSVKQRQFVEASRALGAKDRHIIWKHILPNVMGLVYANVAITVPSAILTEAALTFLGFGDPSIISWGTMLSNAEPSVISKLHAFVWWWFLPPGIAIAVISMAFVFVGFSLDSILNPRLRKR